MAGKIVESISISRISNGFVVVANYRYEQADPAAPTTWTPPDQVFAATADEVAAIVSSQLV